MATKIGYVSQPPAAQINWAEVGANFSGMLNEEARVREEKKAEIDRSTREMMRVLQDTPMGDSANMNQWALNYSAEAQKQLLMLNKMLKSGKLKPSDYTLIRQNLADGTDQAFSLTQAYQDEYADKMQRLKAGDSQYLESYLMETAEGFGNFNRSQLVINPTTGEVLVGFKNPETGELESDPNKLVGISNLKNRITAKFDKYNMDEAVLKGKEMFGEFEGIKRTIGSSKRLGAILQFSDPTLRTKEAIAKYVSDGLISQEQAAKLATYDATEDAWLEGQLSSYNVTSLLTDNLRNIGGQKFNFTSNPAEQDENTILLKQVDGNVVPDFDSEIGKKQRQIAKDGLRTVLRGALDHTEKITTVNDYVPPQPRQRPTESEIERGEARKKEVTNVSNVAKLFYGNDQEVDEAIKFLRSTNPNIARIDRDSNGVGIVYTDGTTEDLTFGGQNERQWVTGSTNFFLPENEKIGDITATIKRSGADFARAFNPSSTGSGFSIVETAEPINDTYKRVLSKIPGFKSDMFEADDEDDTLPKIKSLLKSIPATKGWTVNTQGYGTTDIVEVKDGENLLISFDLDDLTTEKATDYYNQLMSIIISNTEDKDKAMMIEGKQVKASGPSAKSTRGTAGATSEVKKQQVTAAP